MKGDNMNNLAVFSNQEFGTIRTVTIDNEPYFVGKDVAEALGYSKARNAIATHIDSEDKKDAPIQGTLGGMQEMTVINESGLYSLILNSKLPSAKKFKRWVTGEVLPSLRKNGGYIAGQENMTPEQIMAAGLEAARKIIENKDKEIDRMKPKEIFADAVATSHTSILIGDLSKLLRQNGVEIGQRRLFQWMRENGYLIKRKGSDYNMPTQRSMELKIFEIKESATNNPDGSVRLIRTTKVTGKGQLYFINKFLNTKESQETAGAVKGV